MANLKDTIVLGNLTVTGKVVASDILVSGTGNEFDSIKVNLIQDNGGGEIELEASEDIIFTVGGAQPMIISSDNISPNDSASLGQAGNRWGGVYTNKIYANEIIGQSEGTYTLTVNAVAENGKMQINTSTLNLNGGLEIEGSIIPSTPRDKNLGGSSNLWNQAYIYRYMAGNQNYGGSTPSMTAGSTGQVLTSGGSGGNSYWKGIYAHNLVITEIDTSSCRYHCTFINNSPTSLAANPNVNGFSTALYDRGFTNSSVCLAASGVYGGTGKVIGIYGYSKSSSNNNSFGIVYVNSSGTIVTTTVTPPCNITDRVYTL